MVSISIKKPDMTSQQNAVMSTAIVAQGTRFVQRNRSQKKTADPRLRIGGTGEMNI
jgi:hypothetical protein